MSAVAGGALIFLGAVFLFSAGLGLLRMPDPFMRIQAGTKATTLGATLTLAGIGTLRPDWAPTLALFVVFVFASNPISSHALARSGARTGTAMAPGTVVADAEETTRASQEAGP